MLEAIKSLFGIDKTDYAMLIQEGAIILDVRSKSEYSGGHITNSINIPVNELQHNLSKLKNKDQTIITCCASGMRSSSAKNILQNNGYKNVHNGGGWVSLNKKL